MTLSTPPVSGPLAGVLLSLFLSGPVLAQGGAPEAVAAETTESEAATERPWNVVLLLVDDLGFADVGAHGQEYVGTPSIDSIAEDGALFSRVYAPASLSTPSRLGILTGRYPQRSGIDFDVQLVEPLQGIPAGEVTLAEELQAVGYRTALVGKWALGLHAEHHPDQHGFDEFYGFLRDWRRYLPREAGDELDARWALHRDHELVETEEFEHLERHLALESAKKIAAFGDEPFFLVHSFNAVRGPLQLRLDFGTELREMYRGLLSMRRTRMLSMLACLEEATGIVLQALEDAGVADRTIVVFTSDNGGRNTRGEPSDNGDFRGWGGDMTEGGLRVPLFVRWPGVVAEGTVFPGMVSLMDLAPTLRKACGVEQAPAKPHDGVDLVPFLAGEREGAPHEELFFRQGRTRGAVVTAAGAKLLWQEGQSFSHLYDVTADPGEETFLDVEQPDRKAALRRKWRVWNGEVQPTAWRRMKDGVPVDEGDEGEESEDDEDAPAPPSDGGAEGGR